MQNGEGGRAGIQEIGVEHFIGINFPGSFLKGFFQFPDLEKSHGVGEVAAGGVNDVLVNAPDAVGGIDAVGLQECSNLLLVPVPIMNPKVTQGIKAVIMVVIFLSFSLSQVRVAIIAGTPQPNPINKGMKERPDNPKRRKILSITKATRAM